MTVGVPNDEPAEDAALAAILERFALPGCVCYGCRMEVDPDVCWCGDLVEGHNPFRDGHSPLPMGCECRRGAE